MATTSRCHAGGTFARRHEPEIPDHQSSCRLLSVYDNLLLAVQAQDSMAALCLSRHARAAAPAHQWTCWCSSGSDARPDELAGALVAWPAAMLESQWRWRRAELSLLDEPTAGMSRRSGMRPRPARPRSGSAARC